MSMICWLLGVSPLQIVALENTPALAGDAARVARDNARQERMAELLAAMTPEQRHLYDERERENRNAYPEFERELNQARDRIASIGPFEAALCLEKAWHMLHYLMTARAWDTLRDIEMHGAAATPGDALLTGTPLGGDVGYGPARLHDAKAVADFASVIETQDVVTLQARVSLPKMRAEEIYGMPMGPDSDAAYEAELRAEIAHFYPQMRDYVSATARKRYGLLVWLD